MTKPLVRIEGVSKFYPRVHRPGERLRAFASVLAGRTTGEGAEVLHDISLEVHPGQSFGIIGENGAGKSTLLKILTGVISPSNGTVELNARVGELVSTAVNKGEDRQARQGFPPAPPGLVFNRGSLGVISGTRWLLASGHRTGPGC